MKTLLIVLGGAAVVYGSFLLLQNRSIAMAAASGGTLNFTGDNKTLLSDNGVTVMTGPTMQSAPGGVDNGKSQVQRYSTDYTNWFPPITYIEIPGAGSLDDVDAKWVHF